MREQQGYQPNLSAAAEKYFAQRKRETTLRAPDVAQKEQVLLAAYQEKMDAGDYFSPVVLADGESGDSLYEHVLKETATGGGTTASREMVSAMQQDPGFKAFDAQQQDAIQFEEQARDQAWQARSLERPAQPVQPEDPRKQTKPSAGP